MAPVSTNIPVIRLNNGVEIPQLGFGVFQIPPEDTAAAVKLALSVGYRHIDTAQMYGNEAGVAEGIADSGVDPGEVFVTSKLSNAAHGYDEALAAFDQTLAALGAERVDLFLIHWPLPAVGDFVQTWRALERVYSEGRARAIGVSNFTAHHLRKLHSETTVVPAVNQIEAHPYLSQVELRAFNAEHGIATEAWSPIARGGVIMDSVIVELASRLGKTPAQVVLRWHVQLGNIVFPKSVTEARVRENLEIFDFDLSPADMGLLSSLNRDERTGPDPETFNMIPS